MVMNEVNIGTRLAPCGGSATQPPRQRIVTSYWHIRFALLIVMSLSWPGGHLLEAGSSVRCLRLCRSRGALLASESKEEARRLAWAVQMQLQLLVPVQFSHG